MENILHNFFWVLLKGWDIALSMCKSKDSHWALYAKSVLDRTRLALANKAESYHRILQPSAEYLGSLLGVDRWAVCLFMLFYIVSSIPPPSVSLLKFARAGGNIY